MGREREINIATVRFSRDLKNGTTLFVKSPILCKFFELESAAHYGGTPRIQRLVDDGNFNATSISRWGWDEYYRLRNLPRLNTGTNFQTSYAEPAYIVNENAAPFLRSTKLGEGITINLDIPIDEETAKHVTNRISEACKSLYMQYVRKYVIETNVVAMFDAEPTLEETRG